MTNFEPVRWKWTHTLEAQRQHKPVGLPTYDASTIAHHAIVRHMHTRGAPPEPVLAIDVRQFRLEGPQSERSSVTSSWHVAHETMAAPRHRRPRPRGASH